MKAFANLREGQEFKVSHRGEIWIKTPLQGPPAGIITTTSSNAYRKNNPKVTIYIPPEQGVVEQS